MPKVLIAPVQLYGLDTSFKKALLDAGFELVFPKRRAQLTEDELLEILPQRHASLAGSEPYTRKVISACPNLRVIARAGVGYDAVDVPASTEHGVAVTITPNTNQDAVAEHTFCLILALAKDLVNQHLGSIQLKWPRKATLPLRGRVLGLGGLGRIGKAVAIRGHAFGMKMIAYEPYPDHDFAKKYGIELVSWDRLIAESDYLSLHMPATAESKKIINRTSLAKMKPTAFLVNTARGILVEEPDLVAALKNKVIAGAGIDVFELEPPGDHDLFKLDNVVITPHAAGVDLQSRDDMAYSAATAIVSCMKGDWPTEKVVNAPVQAKFRW